MIYEEFPKERQQNMVLCVWGSGSRRSGFRTQLGSVTRYLWDLGKVYFTFLCPDCFCLLNGDDNDDTYVTGWL